MQLPKFFSKQPEITTIPLDTLSCLWVKDGRTQCIGITGFATESVKIFYNDYIVANSGVIKGEPLNIIKRLLILLDLEGNCPSVNEWDMETPDEYKSLSPVNVRDHSINVAKEAFNLLNQGRDNIKIETPAMLIAALGHDVGKIPVVYDSHQFGLGHSYYSIKYLSAMLDNINNGSEITTAIRFLHVQDNKIINFSKF